MTRFPTYPPDVLSRADALLASKYGTDKPIDPLLVEIACEAMMVEGERAQRFLRRAHVAEGGMEAALTTLQYAGDFLVRNKGKLSDNTKMVSLWEYIKKAKCQLERRKSSIAKAIRGTE